MLLLLWYLQAVSPSRGSDDQKHGKMVELLHLPAKMPYFLLAAYFGNLSLSQLCVQLRTCFASHIAKKNKEFLLASLTVLRTG